MTDKRFYTITDLNEKARYLARAAAELMQADHCFTAEDANAADQTTQLNVWDLLRTHDTCGSLLYTLIDILDRESEELNGAESDAIDAAKAGMIQAQGITPPGKFRKYADFV